MSFEVPASDRISSPMLATSTRYSILMRIASGGMGSVHLGVLRGANGFRRVVAIKRAFPHLLEDPTFKRLLTAEARLASYVRHPNVAGVIDVEELDGELLLVMDYVEGGSLSELLRADAIPLGVGMRILLDALEGLRAVHTCSDDEGAPLSLVHRDISPQNILVGVDGVARIADFGIAQIHNPSSVTRSGLLRGKPSYMAPEYIETGEASPASDIFSMGVVAWEVLTRRRLFKGKSDAETFDTIRRVSVPPPSSVCPELPSALDAVILRALARSPERRYATAGELASDFESAVRGTHLLASRAVVGACVRKVVGPVIAQRRSAIAQLSNTTPAAPPSPRHVSAPEIPVVLDDASRKSTQLEAPRAKRRALSHYVLAACAIATIGSIVGVTTLVTQGASARAVALVAEPGPPPPATSLASRTTEALPAAEEPSPAVTATSPVSPRVEHVAKKPSGAVPRSPPKPAPAASPSTEPSRSREPSLLLTPPPLAPENPYAR